MSNESLLSEVKSLRDTYENRMKEAIREAREAYDNRQWNHYNILQSDEASYLRVVQELDAIVRKYEKD